MARYSADHVPTYRLHKRSGQAIVTIAGKDHLLGKHGTPASRERYNLLVARWFESGRTPAAFHAIQNMGKADAGPLVEELIAAFWAHAQTYYRNKDGRPTSELKNYLYDLRILRRTCGSTPAAQFGPLALKSVQQVMIADDIGRKSINRRINRIRHLFKWAVEQELIPSGIFEALRAVSGLKAGRTSARETAPVRPATDAQIEGAIRHANRHVAAMIELQVVTGMRSGEMLMMRTGDIDRSASVWAYTPRRHKTEHHGHTRTVYLGKRAQEIVCPFLKLDPDAYLFSPAEAEAERRAAQTARRKTPLSAGNRPGTNRRRDPRRRPGDQYTVTGYAHAVAGACDKAFPPPPQFAHQKGESVKAWRTRLKRVTQHG